MKKSFLSFVLDQWSPLPPVENADLSGKIVVVIGANAGLGFEAAKHFARMNPAKLVLGCRSESKGKAAMSEIETATGFKSSEVWMVDLANFASVTSFADKFQSECDRLDILVMNAAALKLEYEQTRDGWDLSLQVNNLATALLSLLLLPRLVDTGRKFRSTSRLVIVASEVHYWAVLPEDVKDSPTPIATLSGPTHRDSSSMSRRYFDTKLTNIFFARALQERLQSITPLTVNSVNPGFCYSNIRRNLPVLLTIQNFLMEILLARSTEKGSRQLIFAAIGRRDREDTMKGAYVTRASVDEPSDFVISEEGKAMQDNLWRETIEILTKLSPQLPSILQAYLV